MVHRLVVARVKVSILLPSLCTGLVSITLLVEAVALPRGAYEPFAILRLGLISAFSS
jgi:hypothetical protein